MKDISNILDFAETLLGIKYHLWTPSSKNDIFYCNIIPDKVKIHQQGINCAGFVNILRQYSGLKIPENKWILSGVPTGGTRFWFNYFNSLSKLQYFDYNTMYPIGTLFLRDYKDTIDQGHLAVLYKYNLGAPDKLLFADIIHSYYMGTVENGGVGISNLGMSYFHKMDAKNTVTTSIESDLNNSSNNTSGKELQDHLGFYEYAVLPHDWLAI